jgi:hypothetical protein
MVTRTKASAMSAWMAPARAPSITRARKYHRAASGTLAAGPRGLNCRLRPAAADDGKRIAQAKGFSARARVSRP